MTGGQIYVKGFNARDSNFGIRSLIESKIDNTGSLTIIDSQSTNLTFGTTVKVVAIPTQNNLVISN